MSALERDEWDDLVGAYEDEADEGQFTPEELTMLHRAVRQKLARTRNDMARDRRKGQMIFARRKAERRHDYAVLLLKLDSMVPEDER